MNACCRLLRVIVIAVAQLAAPAECNAEATNLFATKIFGPAAEARQGLAYDAATDRLYTVERATTVVPPMLRGYALNGDLQAGPFALGGTQGSLTKMGLHFLRGGASIACRPHPRGRSSISEAAVDR